MSKMTDQLCGPWVPEDEAISYVPASPVLATFLFRAVQMLPAFITRRWTDRETRLMAVSNALQETRKR